MVTLTLHRRHSEECVGGHDVNSRPYETDELRRAWKRWFCPIYALEKPPCQAEGENHRERILQRAYVQCGAGIRSSPAASASPAGRAARFSRRFFGQSLSLAGFGPFSIGNTTYQRKIDAQLRFTF